MYLQMKLLEISWFPTRLIHLLESRHSLYPCHSSYITLVKSLFYPTRSTYVIILPKLLSRTLSSFILLMNSSIYPSDSTHVILLMNSFTLPNSLYPSDSTHVTLLMNSWIHELYSTLPNSFITLPLPNSPPPLNTPISHETPSSPYAYLNSNHPSNNPINDPLRDNAPNYQQKNEKKEINSPS